MMEDRQDSEKRYSADAVAYGIDENETQNGQNKQKPAQWVQDDFQTEKATPKTEEATEPLRDIYIDNEAAAEETAVFESTSSPAGTAGNADLEQTAAQADPAAGFGSTSRGGSAAVASGVGTVSQKQVNNNEAPKKQKLFTAIAVVSLLINLFLAGGIIYLFLNQDSSSPSAQHYTEGQSVGSTVDSSSDSNAITAVADSKSGAVVRIETTVVSSGSGNSLLDEYYKYYFGVPDEQQQSTGLGSGFLISADGYILTNEHVIDGASSIKVSVTGYDEAFEAEVIGSDYDLDLAVLKIKTDKDLPYLELGDSEQLQVGDWAIAIGNPYGLDHTVTLGVISAMGRAVTVEDRSFENLLQTDASINPGNSGGPLLDIDGNVIGINNAVSQTAQGIGFAIPINTVKEVLNELIENGKVTTPWLGISMQAVNDEVAAYFNVTAGKGVLINSVYQNSPAAAAGLQQYDIVLQIDGQEVNTPDELKKAISSKTIGDKVELLIQRSGQTTAVTAEIGEKN